MTVKQLEKDVETVKRALNLGPQPEWKKRYKETVELLKGIERLHNAFAQLPLEEQERQIQELENCPATDFVHGSPELEIYAESMKRATIRDLVSIKNRGMLENDESNYP